MYMVGKIWGLGSPSGLDIRSSDRNYNTKNGKGYQKEIQQDGECIKELGGEELFKLVFGKHYATYIEIAKSGV